MGEITQVRFFGGLDDTHYKRDLPFGMGVRCIDLDLRYGRFQPRKDLYPFQLGGSNLTVPASVQLAFSCYSANGEQLLFLAAGDGTLKMIKEMTFDTKTSLPHSSLPDDVIDRDTGMAVNLQTTEPMEWARFGNVIYISNAGAATGTEKDWSTLRLDLQDLKATLLIEAEWPKSRHITNYLNYAVLGNLSVRGPRTILATDLPLVGQNAITWEADNWDEPQTDPDDRVMRLIYNGRYLLAFFKRSLWRYVGAPTHWRANQLLDIGTLAPKSVEFLGGNVYFLGNDGIPRRTNGQEMVAEKVGAFDYQGKLKHIDGRSPIETGLRSYHLGSSAAGASEATFRWDSKLRFDNEATYVLSEYKAADEQCAGGVHPVKLPDWIERKDTVGSQQLAPIPTYSEYEDGTRDLWQSFRLARSTTTPPEGDTHRIRYSHLAYSIELNLYFPGEGEYELKVHLLDHNSDSALSNTLTEIATATATHSAVEEETAWVTFDLQDKRIEDNIEVLRPGPLNSARYRITVTRSDDSGYAYWWYDAASSYGRGRAGPSAQTGWDLLFRYLTYRYERVHVGPIMHVSAYLKTGNAIERSARTWRDVTFKIHENAHATATVYLTRQKVLETGYVRVRSSGININSLFSPPPDWLRWKVVLEHVLGWGGDHAALESIAISLTRAETYGHDDPAAISWDGRYCLSLRRLVSVQRDIYVWDRDAWSRWENVGFDQAAVMDDTVNRQRLVTVDAVPVNVVPIGDCRTICLFLEEFRPTGWRSLTPKFQTGVLTLANLQVASPFEMAVIYNEATGTRRGDELMIRHRLDGGRWCEDSIPLDGELSPDLFPPRTSRASLANDEGRHIEVLVGENPSDPAWFQNPGVEVDAVYIDAEVVGPRRGYHTGA